MKAAVPGLAALAGWAVLGAAAQSDVPMQHASGAMSFFFEEISHVLVGAMAAVAGVFGHRAWSRRRWRRAPAGVVTEAVLVVDLVDSTKLATRHGDNLAMRARIVLERRSLAAGEKQGATFVENTGDGSMMTFPSVAAAAKAAKKLLAGLRERPPDMSPGPPLEIRAAITYGEILLDARGARHGAAMNKAFRLMAVRDADFVTVAGEPCLNEIPDRNRVFMDEDAFNELNATAFSLRQVGVCRLKGFSGFQRVYDLLWSAA